MAEFRVSAPGKLILYGEHAVVYGKTAVAGSLDLRTTLDFKESPVDRDYIVLSMAKIRMNVRVPTKQIRDYFYGESAEYEKNTEDEFWVDDHEDFYRRVEKFVETIGFANLQQKFAVEVFFYMLVSICKDEIVDLRAFDITIDTALSISSGLGSSASFAVCLATTFIHWSNLRKHRSTAMNNELLSVISRRAYNCERIMHGNPSGIDNSVCTFGSIMEFRRGEKLEPILGVKSMRVLLVDTRVQRSTKALVEKLASLKDKYPAIFLPIIDSIDNVAKEALAVIKRIREIPEHLEDRLYKEYKELMTLIEVNQGLLATCQVSHNSLDCICAEAKNYALAAKLTGAGGGGYAYILLLPNTPNETITSITKKLIANGYLVTLTNLGGAGVTIHE